MFHLFFGEFHMVTSSGGFHKDVRNNFGFFDPLVRKFTQPPLLRMLTMSAFEGNPLPPQCGCPKWKPPRYITADPPRKVATCP